MPNHKHNTEDTRMVGVWLDIESWRRLHDYAASQGISMAEVMRRAWAEFEDEVRRREAFLARAVASTTQRQGARNA
ncbi:MAG: hypothetical protein IJL06_05950 [Kiritimatiellae bacterium]|nr:hypothetical protein [Kiritimatiellia bacterium]